MREPARGVPASLQHHFHSAASENLCQVRVFLSPQIPGKGYLCSFPSQSPLTSQVGNEAVLLIPPWARQRRFHGNLRCARGGSFSQATHTHLPG